MYLLRSHHCSWWGLYFERATWWFIVIAYVIVVAGGVSDGGTHQSVEGLDGLWYSALPCCLSRKRLVIPDNVITAIKGRTCCNRNFNLDGARFFYRHKPELVLKRSARVVQRIKPC